MQQLPKTGDRVRLLQMHDDPDPIATGSVGTVISACRHVMGTQSWDQVDVSWENGRTLMLVSPPDMFEIISSDT